MGIKGVILAAGYGTRFLPVTRCLPKEMLPLVDRPAIDFVVQEMVEAGLEQVVVITSRPARIRDIFEIPFPYPRDEKLKSTPEFLDLREKLKLEVMQEYQAQQDRG